MRFARPEYFWLFAALPLLIGFFMWAWQRKQAALRKFAALSMIPRLTPSVGAGRQIARWTFFLLFFFFLILALVRPRFGVKTEMVERKGVDIMIALDVSKSMLAQDISPNRIDRAKHEIGKLIGMLKGDRIGIVVFAGESFVQCPLTVDYGAAKMFLDAVNTSWIALQGTSLSGAVGHAMEAFHSKTRKHKVLVILSDGEDHEGEAVKAAQNAAKEGAKIYTVGLGSESGVPIPLKKSGGNVIYKKDKSGNLVMSKLNQAVLEEIAVEGNGKYFHAGTDLDLAFIYGEIMKMEKKDLGMNRMTVYREQYQIFLLIALLFLFVEFFIPERVTRKQEWKGRFH
ncbi:MAG: VWA domain-containing protein [Chitinivibrionales bacterium]|nr:VWA domain-containing protein [Chitinivibrionales bacterium]